MTDKLLTTATNEQQPRWPIGVQVDLTNRCTGRCDYCGHRSWPQVDLPELAVRRVVHVTQRQGFQSLSLTGGSPQLHPAFWDVVDYARRLGLGVNVFTDGLGWTWPGGGAVMPNRLQFSVDTLDPERYAAVRGVNGLRRALDTVEDALARGIPCRLMATVVPGAVREAFSLVPWVADRRERGLPLDWRAYLVNGYGQFTRDDRVEVFGRVGSVLKYYGAGAWHNAVELLDAIHAPREVYRPRRCVIPRVHRVVAADGLIFGCCYANMDNATWNQHVEAARAVNALGHVDDDGGRGFEKAWLEFDDEAVARYERVELGTPCRLCSTVNSRYAAVNRAWDAQADEHAPAYI